MEQKNSESNDAHSMGAGKTPSSNSRRKRLVRLIGCGLFILVLAFGIPYLLHTLSHESTDDAFIDGTIVAISPRIGGTVAKVIAGNNRWVHAGDPLVELDARDLKARQDAAAASLEAAKAAALATEAQVETAKAQAAAAESHRDQAEAQLTLAEATLAQYAAEASSKSAEHQRDVKDLQRAREMSKTGTITEQGLDHAVADEQISAADQTAAERKVDTQKADVRQAASALAASEDGLRQARAQIKARQAQVSQSQADIDRAKADLEQAALQLSYTRILAPIDGYVTRKSVEQGAYVQVGQVLMAIVSSDVWVIANFKETQITRMRPGQSAVIKVDTYPDVTFEGYVDSIQRGTGAWFSLLPPENATGNFIKVVQRVPVKIVFNRTDQTRGYLLVPGLSVQPEVDIHNRGYSMDLDGEGDLSTAHVDTDKGSGSNR